MSISFKQIRYFAAAAETRRISQAAIELNVSQSAVTAAIQQLEAHLGTRLLDRHPAGVSPTLDGSRFLAHAHNILAAVAEAERLPQDGHRAVTGTLRVGVTYTVAGYFLPRHLMRFKAAFPQVALDVSEAPRASIETALVDGGLDLAILLVSNLGNRSDLGFETLLKSPRRLWLSAEHPLMRRERVSLRDVGDEDYVMLTVDEADDTSRRYWDAAGLAPRTVFATSSVEAVRSLVAGGVGVTILSDMVYRPWSLEGQRLETRHLAEDIPSMDVGLAWRDGAELSPAAVALRDFLRFAYL